MLRSLNRYLNYSLRQNKSMDFDKIAEKRRFLMQEIYGIYSHSDRPHVDRVYEEVVYGKKCNIVGLTPNSEQSATYIRSICLGLRPDHVILGGFNNSRLISDRIAKTTREKRSARAYDTFIEPSKLFCKTLITPMVTKLTEEDPNCCLDQKKQTVFIFDHKNKHVHASNYLTILYRIMHHQFSKVAFGMPSDYIIFEDLMINQSIDTLRQIFYRVIETTKQNKDQHGIPQTSFEYYPDLILEQIRYNAVSQPILSKKQLTYTTALLNKSAGASQRVMLFVQNHYLQQIADNVHKIKIDPKDVFRAGCTNVQDFIKNTDSEAGMKINRYLNAENKEESINQLIEKMIILNQLKNNTLENDLLVDGHNIFNKTVFAQLFDGLSVEQIQERYRRIKTRYAEAIGEIVEIRVNATMSFKEPQKNFYTLTQMIKTQEQRNIDFPSQIQPNNYETIRQNQIDVQEIHKQIQQMIKKQLTFSDKELIEEYFKGRKTRASVVLFQKLLVQAKLRLNKTNYKLPVYHYGAMSGIFKDQIKNRLLSNKPRKTQKEFVINKIQELKDQGKIKQIQTEEQLNQIIGLDGPRLSFQMDEETGQVSFQEDANTVESIKKVMKNDQFMKEMFEMNETHKDKHEQSIYRQQDQQEPKIAQKHKERGFKRILRKK